VSLPHVLLGLLHETPRTGYDLARALREEMDPVWSAGFSQIYPTLARLRRRGWVLLRVLGPRHGPRRNLYRVTAAGRRELARWLGETPPVPRGNDETLSRIALLDAVPAAERRRAMAAAESALGAEVARLRALPLAGGYTSLARRGAIERHEALRRFLRAGGAAPLSISEAHGSRHALRKKR
jgi:DNA-binding PadR family transcriptional regulator